MAIFVLWKMFKFGKGLNLVTYHDFTILSCQFSLGSSQVESTKAEVQFVKI